MTSRKTLIYRINNKDDICYVNEEWDRFAQANNGELVISTRVLQRPIWDFITDETTRHLYRKIFRNVRKGKTAGFELRCDSPKTRRLLQITILPLNDGVIEFRSDLLCETAQDCPALLDTARERSGVLLRVCAWCNRIYMGDAWIEIEDAVARFPLFHDAKLPFITHGMCENCFDRMDDLGNEP